MLRRNILALLSSMVSVCWLPSLEAEPVVEESAKANETIRKARFIVSVGEGDDRIRLARVREIPEEVGELVVGGVYYDGDVFAYLTVISGWQDDPCKDVTLGKFQIPNEKEQMTRDDYVAHFLKCGWAVI